MNKSVRNTYSPRLSDRLLGWSDNEIYGHGRIIREYTGLNRRILGHLQHGWNPYSGWTLAGKELLGQRSFRYVWGERQLSYSERKGIQVNAAVGAPWLYGPYQSIQNSEPQPTAGTLLIPMHGTSEHPVTYSHTSLADQVAATFPGPLTVCLHHNEARNGLLTQIYAERDYQVVTAGSPFDSAFLYRQASFLANSHHVVTNRVSTALFYAGSLKRRVSLVAQEATIRGEGDREPDELARLRWHINEMGDDTNALHDLSMYELGYKYIRETHELPFCLGMRGPRRRQYPFYLALSHSRRVIRRFS